MARKAKAKEDFIEDVAFVKIDKSISVHEKIKGAMGSFEERFKLLEK